MNRSSAARRRRDGDVGARDRLWLTTVFLGLLCLPSSPARSQAVASGRSRALKLALPSEVVRGAPIEAIIRGAVPFGRVRVSVSREQRLDSGSVHDLPAGRARFVSAATVQADAAGTVRLAQPRSTTSDAIDPLRWLWAATPSMIPAASRDTIQRGLLRIEASAARRRSVRGDVRLVGMRTGISARILRVDGLDGVYAVPAGAGQFATVILLHGSEDGDSASAMRSASRFASHGFAALALNYFVWGSFRANIPTALINVPVEMLDRAHDWLSTEPTADTSKLGIVGVSKGAEFSLVVASARIWPKAVVACVPSDVMWAGFGRELKPGERNASWSLRGESLPFIPYDRYEDALSGKLTAEIVHTRSRVLFADSVERARIPVERIRAPLLLLGGERDEVWPSATMVRSIARDMKAHGSTTALEIHTYPGAGHGNCGDGATPAAFSNGNELHTDHPPSREQTAAGGADAWRQTITFLRAHLSPNSRGLP